MPETTAELVNLLDLKREGEVFVGSQPQTMMQRTYGGQVLAQALTAAYGTVGSGRTAHSLHAYFLRPGAVTAPISYEVDALRDGNTFSTRQVTAIQGENEIFTMAASFHAEEPGLDHNDPEPMYVPPPDHCPSLADVMDDRFGKQPIWHEWDAIDARFIGDSTPGGSIKPGRHIASMRLWVRTESALPDGIALHQAVMAYLSDLALLSVSTVPHPVVFMSDQLQAARQSTTRCGSTANSVPMSGCSMTCTHRRPLMRFRGSRRAGSSRMDGWLRPAPRGTHPAGG